jgi:proteasome lid subunit RPN8/RPN11
MEGSLENDATNTNDLKGLLELSKDCKLDLNDVQPFAVKVCPDAMFLADFHAHLSESEIIGLLGGRYVPSENCLYVQAAYPCKSTSRGDAGLTDVEMDPISQIAAGNAIVNQGMTVVGWYHSHPRFQPDPSITDIENQSNYQNLFQSDLLKSQNNSICPFVGLIIGTYGKRSTAVRVLCLGYYFFPHFFVLNDIFRTKSFNKICYALVSCDKEAIKEDFRKRIR